MFARQRTINEFIGRGLCDEDEDESEGDLVQVGLKYKCYSNCFGLNEEEAKPFR